MKLQTANSSFGGRLPRQIQRAAPVYIASLIFVLLFISSAHTIGSAQTNAATDVFQRLFSPQASLASLPRMKFPRKFWQLWKIDPLSFEERDLERAKSWTALNPTYRYEVLTDSNDLQWVEMYFGKHGLNRLDVVWVYKTLGAKIIKADLLRYMIMYVEGGTYADIDVEALRPIDEWIPPLYRIHERNIDMIVGVEIDQPGFGNHPILGSKSQSFVQWTFVAKPRLPVMMRLINNIIAWLIDLATLQGVPISELVLGFDDIISGTGPSAFTNAILAEMAIKDARPITWTNFHNLTEPVLVGGVLVLTVKAFAAGQGHSNSGDHSSPDALVQHHYHASGWPKKHPRYSHIIYGEVEYCNWDVECVDRWDADKLAFEKMSKEEQDRTVEDQEAAWKAQADREAAEQAAQEKAAAEEEAAKQAAAQKLLDDQKMIECEASIKLKYGIGVDEMLLPTSTPMSTQPSVQVPAAQGPPQVSDQGPPQAPVIMPVGTPATLHSRRWMTPVF